MHEQLNTLAFATMRYCQEPILVAGSGAGLSGGRNHSVWNPRALPSGGYRDGIGLLLANDSNVSSVLSMLENRHHHSSAEQMSAAAVQSTRLAADSLHRQLAVARLAMDQLRTAVETGAPLHTDMSPPTLGLDENLCSSTIPSSAELGYLRSPSDHAMRHANAIVGEAAERTTSDRGQR